MSGCGVQQSTDVRYEIKRWGDTGTQCFRSYWLKDMALCEAWVLGLFPWCGELLLLLFFWPRCELLRKSNNGCNGCSFGRHGVLKRDRIPLLKSYYYYYYYVTAQTCFLRVVFNTRWAVVDDLRMLCDDWVTEHASPAAQRLIITTRGDQSRMINFDQLSICRNTCNFKKKFVYF